MPLLLKEQRMTTFFNYCKQLIGDYLFTLSSTISFEPDFESCYALTEKICAGTFRERDELKNLLYRWWDDLAPMSEYLKIKYGEMSADPFYDPAAYFDTILHESIMNIFEQFMELQVDSKKREDGLSLALFSAKLESVTHFTYTPVSVKQERLS